MNDLPSPSTPRNLRKRPQKRTVPEDDDDDSTDNEPSAKKKRQWKRDWVRWVSESKWEKDPSYKQKVGSEEIHGSDAMKFYNLTGEEMDTLPFWKFENINSLSHPGRSYVDNEVKRLAYRKLAMLVGFHKEDMEENELLRQGYILFEEKQIQRRQGNPNTPTEPITGTIFIPKPHETYRNPLTGIPHGCWESPVWRNGVLIGHWLNAQFTPDDDGEWIPKERFKPLGSDTWIEQRG
ncbi:uncharacterized protein LY89DRAFT_773675 [Mollisia scopiformis]|uniref:Uncharacterized protein n=1 Tax=Mollisia scopiformis TaxID=149040 RepID=A0A194XGQ7_MOLSC|nr:uncharacterized protein LY89DRAFT_773675 [Mollisia scopiformis]KUJ19353.1 hypothetical protein LY89DRAFT_773675 [Mollisia scopiformis]